MEKYYYELTVKPNLYYELFLDLIDSLTAEAIEELENETIIVRSEDDLSNIQDGLESFAKELTIAFNTQIDCELNLEKKENQDWIKLYQESVQPIEVGQFYIHPSWNTPKEDKLNIVIDPTLAFGSGHHETTNECLRAISKYVKRDMLVCDVGTGSGILGIAASSLGAKVDICDTDPVSVEDSIKNFNTNKQNINTSWEGSANNTSNKYDVVIANIVADVLVMIARDLKKITKDGGILILSGIMEQHKEKVIKKFLKDNKCKIIEELQKNEWVTLVAKIDKEGK